MRTCLIDPSGEKLVRFAAVINEFTDQVRELGPSPFASKRPLADAEEVA